MSGTARKRRGEVAHSITIPLYGWLVHGSRVVHMGIVDGSRRAIGGHGGACGALSGLRWPSSSEERRGRGEEGDRPCAAGYTEGRIKEGERRFGRRRRRRRYRTGRALGQGKLCCRLSAVVAGGVCGVGRGALDSGQRRGVMRRAQGRGEDRAGSREALAGRRAKAEQSLMYVLCISYVQQLQECTLRRRTSAATPRETRSAPQ